MKTSPITSLPLDQINRLADYFLILMSIDKKQSPKGKGSNNEKKA